MTGIKEAMKRVAERRNEGTAVSIGHLKECTCKKKSKCDKCSDIRYMIVKLEKNGELITVYDYGLDIHIADDITPPDEVFLTIKDNWSASWIKKGHLAEWMREGGFPKKYVFFNSLPIDSVFVHKGDTYRKIAEGSAFHIFTEQEAYFETQWGCIISKQQFKKYKLTNKDVKK